VQTVERRPAKPFGVGQKPVESVGVCEDGHPGGNVGPASLSLIAARLPASKSSIVKGGTRPARLPATLRTSPLLRA
jgi:hypothetical protein